MTFRGQIGRKGTSKQFSKSAHEKRAKEKKKRLNAKYFEETPQFSSKQITDKTLVALKRLGNQVFALSPFSQYFDDWIVNLGQVVTEFETNPAIKADEQFQRDRTQIFKEVEDALAENELAESSLTSESKALTDNNNKIVDADKEYSRKTRELSNKRNSELQRLNGKIRELEDDIALQQQTKFSFFKFGDKKRAAEKLAQTSQNLTATKNELETATQDFKAEQDKIHDNYNKLKQELNEVSDRLHTQLERLETDTSILARQTACNALAQAVNNLSTRSSADS
jgi:chromosome segregation ATPase